MTSPSPSSALPSNAAPGRLIDVDGPKLGHIPSFDGLRGIFIIQVVLYHAEVTTSLLTGSPILIDWFFVASGFLITSLLLDEVHRSGSIGLRRFYKRRALRLFPAMYAMIAVFTVLFFLARTLSPEVAEKSPHWYLEPLSAALYCYNIVAAFFPATMGVLGYLWSLAVEEQFYFLWPPLLRRVLRNGSRRRDLWLIGGCAAFIVVFFSLRYGLQSVVQSSSSTGEPTFADKDAITWQGVTYRIACTRPDVIVLGCLAAFVVKKIPRPVPAHVAKWLGRAAIFAWLWFAGVIIFCKPGPPGVLAMFGGPVYQIGLLLLPVMIVDGYLRKETWYSRLASIRPARWLGVRIYGIYVWHGIVLLVCAPAILAQQGLQAKIVGTFASALAIGAGIVSYRFLERPFLRRASKI